MSNQDQSQDWEPNTWDELFPGRFLKHSHLDGEVEVLLERIYATEIDGKPAQVARISPIPGVKQRDWGLNKTNGIVLRALFGEAVKADWTGKRVFIKRSVVEHGREKGKPCIRICASRDIERDQKVVVDFKTKRIKPFTILVRAAGSKESRRQDTQASPFAKELASRFRAAQDAAELTALVLDIESALESDPPTITREEAKGLMSAITKKEQELKNVPIS